MGSVSFPLRAYDKFAAAATFRGRTWQWIDPVKDAQGMIMNLQAGTISLSDAAEHYGKDAEELFSQIQRDRELANQFGVSYAMEPFGAQKMPINPEGYGDEP
jgi:capsid protein